MTNVLNFIQQYSIFLTSKKAEKGMSTRGVKDGKSKNTYCDQN
jgi:hypothetical protein